MMVGERGDRRGEEERLERAGLLCSQCAQTVMYAPGSASLRRGHCVNQQIITAYITHTQRDLQRSGSSPH